MIGQSQELGTHSFVGGRDWAICVVSPVPQALLSSELESGAAVERTAGTLTCEADS